MSSKIRDIGVFNVKNMGYRGKKNLIYMQLRVMRVKRDVSQKELSARMQVMGFSMDQQQQAHRHRLRIGRLLPRSALYGTGAAGGLLREI